MKIILILSMVACANCTIICYELNQTQRKQWVMDLIGIAGTAFMFTIPFLAAIGIKYF